MGSRASIDAGDAGRYATAAGTNSAAQSARPGAAKHAHAEAARTCENCAHEARFEIGKIGPNIHPVWRYLADWNEDSCSRTENRRSRSRGGYSAQLPHKTQFSPLSSKSLLADWHDHNPRETMENAHLVDGLENCQANFS